MLRVRPASGAAMRDPQTGAWLPAEGGLVPETQYWLRRIADGAVVELSDDEPEQGEVTDGDLEPVQ